MGGREARIALAQLWMTEGIPFAFVECPVLYDSVRLWLGKRLNVHAKEISITGSGRTGESLNPQRTGKPFDAKSDLDLFVYRACSIYFEMNSADGLRTRGVVWPRHEGEENTGRIIKLEGQRLFKRGLLTQR